MVTEYSVPGIPGLDSPLNAMQPLQQPSGARQAESAEASGCRAVKALPAEVPASLSEQALPPVPWPAWASSGWVKQSHQSLAAE
jgi:hypothetical protein